MKRINSLLILLFLFCNNFVYSQKNRIEESLLVHPIDQRITSSSFKKEFCGTTLEQVSAYLTKNISHLGNEKCTTSFINKTESKKGFHFLFDQQYEGRTIYRATIKVNVDKSGHLTSLFDNSFATDRMPDVTFPTVQTAELLLSRLPHQWYKFEPVYFFDGKAFLAGGRVEVMESNVSYYELIIDRNGNEVYRHDLVSYNCPPPPPIDTMVTGYVFLPDPLTTAGVSYGAPYVDDSNNDVVVLNDERVLVDFYAQFDTIDSTFSLKSPYVNITEFSAPVTVTVSTDTPIFNFTRSEPEFEEVNAFYHISMFQRHMQDLGFNLVNYAINVDAHALTSDNSMFVSGANPPRLFFGDGGVDDAEDADVILHEYGHAIMFSAAPGTNSGTQRKSLDEANGDYFASSYSRFLNPFQWENVFSWDGHNEYWPGRSSVSSKHYPENISSDYYSMTDIWSGTLMQIWGDIGRDATDELLLESAYSYSGGMSMADAAQLIMEADTLLNAGAYSDSLLNRFIARGLIEENDTTNDAVNELSADRIYIKNTWGFATGNSLLAIEFDKATDATIELYSSQGVLLRRNQVQNTQKYSFDPPPISSGVYVLNILTPQSIKTTKLIKF